MVLFLTSADASAANGGGSMLVMMIVLIAVFYFFMIRPENKRKKEAQAMRDAIKVGDNITTIGGIIGDVVSVKDDSIVIETSEDRVRVEFLKSAIGQVGTLDEQAAAQQRPVGKKDKKAEKADETPAVEEKTSEEPVETTAEEKTDAE